MQRNDVVTVINCRRYSSSGAMVKQRHISQVQKTMTLCSGRTSTALSMSGIANNTTYKIQTLPVCNY